MSKTDQKIEELTNMIEKLVNKPAPVVAPIAPIAPLAPVLQNYSGDHDLLTKLDTKVDQIQSDVLELRKDRNIYVNQAEHNEIVKQCGDHEKRLRTLESSVTRILTWGSIAIVLVGILETILSVYFHSK